MDKNSYYDLPLEKTNDVKKHVVEWFGGDYGLAIIGDEFWMVSYLAECSRNAFNATAPLCSSSLAA